MDISSIAENSIDFSLMQTQETAETLIMKNSLDFEKDSAESLMQMLDSVPPSSHILDQLV